MRTRLWDYLRLFLLLGALFSLAPAVGRLKLGASTPAADELTPTGLFLSVLGEMRYTLAAYLWIKVDLYHHEMLSEGHDWRTNKAIMPLIRMATRLDPHFYQAYDFGGYHLAINLKKPKEGIHFLQEGLKNNPGQPELLLTLGQVYYIEGKYLQAVFPLERALNGFSGRVERANTLRLLAHSWRQLGKKDKALPYLKALLKLEPENPWARKQLEEIEGK